MCGNLHVRVHDDCLRPTGALGLLTHTSARLGRLGTGFSLAAILTPYLWILYFVGAMIDCSWLD